MRGLFGAAGASGLEKPLDRPADIAAYHTLSRHLHGRPGRGGSGRRYATELGNTTIGSSRYS
jgi:hypothetical protein